MDVQQQHVEDVAKEDGLDTVAPLAPITAERRIRSDLEKFLPKPYLARALIAPDTENPNGTLGHKNQDMSVLQQHVAFFDQDHNGILYPWESYKGFRAIGFNFIFAVLLAVGFHIFFSFPTMPGWLPSPLLPIYIKNIHKGKHGSDSDVYDTEGRFVPVNLENLFSKYACTAPNKFTLIEVWNMTQGNGNAYDIIGWITAKLEWGLLYYLAKDEEGFLSKEAVRSLFDGSLFEYMSKARHGHLM